MQRQCGQNKLVTKSPMTSPPPPSVVCDKCPDCKSCSNTDTAMNLCKQCFENQQDSRSQLSQALGLEATTAIPTSSSTHLGNIKRPTQQQQMQPSSNNNNNNTVSVLQSTNSPTTWSSPQLSSWESSSNTLSDFGQWNLQRSNSRSNSIDIDAEEELLSPPPLENQKTTTERRGSITDLYQSLNSLLPQPPHAASKTDNDIITLLSIPSPSRYLILQTTSRDFDNIYSTVSACGTISVFDTSFAIAHNVILVAFFDIRASVHALNTLGMSDNNHCSLYYSIPQSSSSMVLQLSSKSPLSPNDIMKLCTPFGTIATVTSPSNHKKFAVTVEFNDIRDLYRAVKALDGLSFNEQEVLCAEFSPVRKEYQERLRQFEQYAGGKNEQAAVNYNKYCMPVSQEPQNPYYTVNNDLHSANWGMEYYNQVRSNNGGVPAQYHQNPYYHSTMYQQQQPPSHNYYRHYDASQQNMMMLHPFSKRRSSTNSTSGGGRNDQGIGEYSLCIDSVRNGLDKRTTLMIRNIPNKYTQQMLLSEINSNHTELYDFFYLPIDFKNKCNMGYAFINFIDYESILPFFREFSNQKWKSFNSEKICAISYARLQGKAAMIARFQNSSLLDKDESYRPLVFASAGENRGKPETFPVGNNGIRKNSMEEESQQSVLYNTTPHYPPLPPQQQIHFTQPQMSPTEKIYGAPLPLVEKGRHHQEATAAVAFGRATSVVPRMFDLATAATTVGSPRVQH